MASISGNGSRGHHKFTLEVIESSYSIDNNTSDVSYSFKLAPITKGYNWSGWGSQISYKIIINGTEYTGTIPSYDGKSTVTLKSGSQTIPHNNDGTKSIDFSFSVTDSTGQSYTSGSASASGSLTLTTIPRASSITVNDANISSATNIVINKTSSSFTTTLYYKASGQNSWTKIVDKTSNQVYGWIVPTSFYSLIPNSKTIQCQFYAETYNGSTLVGTSSTVTATFTATGNPVINSSSAVDINNTTIALTGSNSKMIRYASNVQVSVSASGQNSASISSIRINGTTASNGVVTFNSASTNSFEIVVTDSRGYTTSRTLTMTMVNYIPLTIDATITRNQPTDGIVKVSYSGNYFKDTFGSESNTLTVQYRSREKNGTWGSWTNLSPAISSSSNTYSQTTTISGYNYQKQYEFEIRAIDKIQTKNITGINVSKGQPIYWWDENGLYVNGTLKTNDVDINNIFLAKTGGTVSGNLNVTGNLQKNGSSVALTSQIPTNNNQLINGSGFVTFETIWQNNSMSAFASQTVTLDKSINNYTYYETIYKINDEQDFYVSSGKTPVGLYNSTVSQDGFKFVYRYITAMQGTSVSFGDCRQVNSYGSGTTVKNDSLIPYRIIVYK